MSWTRLQAVSSLLCVVVAGCVDNNQRLASLQKKTDDLQAQVKTLQESLDKEQNERRWDKFVSDSASVAYLTPGSEGYSVIKSDLGYLTVQLANVQPYANGTRVTLRIGNLTSARINGAKATLEWGRVDERGNPKNDEAQSRDIRFNESLRAGAWTEVPVVLEGVPPQEFGFVRVRDLSHAGIRLLR
jgi:hypothetical protein